MSTFNKIGLALLLMQLPTATADGITNPTTQFIGDMSMGAGVANGTAATPQTGKLLLVAGVFRPLLVDGVSKICLAGGC